MNWKTEIKKIGYDGDYNLSLVIDWIREEKKFFIWVEHGSKNKNGFTHDLTISDGKGHGGSYRTFCNKYSDAQIKGIEMFVSYIYSKNWVNISDELPTYYKLVKVMLKNNEIVDAWMASDGFDYIWTILDTDIILDSKEIIKWKH
jgi:hypothetical protein